MPKLAGNSIATAFDITTIDTNIKIFEDTISNTDSFGYYKFTIAENSKLNIKLSGLSQNVDLFLLNADESQIPTQSVFGGNVDENIIQNLKAGSYYFYVRGGGTETNYKIETSAISLGAIPVDSAGSSLDRANNLGTLGTTAKVVNEFIGNFNGLDIDYADYHQFTISENSTVNLKLTGLSQNAAISLLDSQGTLITGSENSPADKNITQNLRLGNYYVFITNSGGNGTSYQLSSDAVSLGAVPVDNAGESPYKAKNLGTLGTTETVANDFLGNFNGLSTDSSDYYQFTIAENSTVNLKLSGLSQNVNLNLYDSQGNIVVSSLTGGNADENITRNLRAGTYYAQATGGETGTNYQLTASAISLGAVPVDNVGDSLDKAKNVGILGNTAIVIDEYVGNFGNFGGSIDYSDYYQFTITNNSTVNLNLSGLSQDTNISLLDSQGNIIKTSDTSGTSDENISQKLRSGTYFVSVSPASGLNNGSNYRFSANAVGLGSTPVDTNFVFDQASDLGTLSGVIPTLQSEISSDNYQNYYKFTLSENSNVNFKLSGLSQDANIEILGSQGNTIIYAANPGTVDETIGKNLRAGVYYIRAYRGFSGDPFANPKSLTFKLDASVTSLGAIPIDLPGNSIDQSKDLGTLKTEAVSATDFLGNFNNLSDDYTDYYKFTLADNSTVNLKLSGLSQDANLVLLNSNGNTILSSSNTGSSDENISRNLPKGTYYVRIDAGIGLFGFPTGPDGIVDAKNTTYKLDASAIALGAIPVDNAGENIDQAKDLGTIKTEVISATDFLGSFKDLADDYADYYKFTITDNSTVSLKLSGLSEDANFSLLNNRGTIILSSINTGSSDENISRNLQKGTYYVRVDGGIGLFGMLGAPGSPNNAKGTNYKLDVSAVSIGAPPIDNAGETINQARDLGVISEPQQIADYVGNFNGLSNDSADYYKFRVTTDSFLNLNFTETAINPNLQLFNSAGKSISAPINPFGTVNTSTISQGVAAGTYYLGVTPNGNVGSNYKLNLAAPTITDLAGSDNQTARDVGVLNGARTFTDFIGSIDSSDVYRFELKEKSTFNLNFNPDKSNDKTYLSLTNAKGQWLNNFNAGTEPISKELDAGVYYAGIYNYGGANSDTNYNLNLSAITKQNSAFQILNVTPIAGSNQGEASIDIKGTKFTPTAKVSIVDPAGKEVNSSAMTVLNDTSIAAKFDLKGQVIGAYDVKVVDGTDQALVNDIYLVNDLAPGRLQVDIAAPGVVRPGATGELIITYRNAGNTDIPAPLLTLVAKGALLEESGEYKDGTIQFLGINKEGNAGVLPAGATGSVRVKFRSALDATNIDFQVNSLGLDENVDWNGIKDSSRPEGIAADVWDKIYSNFVTSVGGKASEFQKVLNDNANRLSQLGEYTGDISRLLSFELQQVNSNAISARSTVGAFGRGGVNPWDVSAITDAAGNVAIQTGDRRRTFTKGKDGKYQGITDDLGILTKVGDVYQIKEFDGTIQSFLANGKLDFIQDTNGNKVTLGYTANLLTGLSYSNGDKVSFKYNPQGRVNEVVDINGQSTTYTYDPTGERLLSVSDVSGAVSYTYETEGAKANAIKSITYPDGTQSLFEYDDLGRVTKESLNGGEQTLKYSYDSTGGVTVTDANNQSTQVLLNDRGQVAQTTDALGRISRFSYDSKGNLTQVLAPDSSNAKFTYDSKGNLLASTDALGQSVQFAYDSRYDQIKSVKDQKGNAINYTYDDKGNLGTIGYADGSKESFTYSDKGDVTVSSNRRGQEISYTYDSRGLLTKKAFADGTSAAFEYDVRGNLTKATDADSSVTYGYDAADRLTNVSYGGTRSLSFSYDAGGRRSKMVDQDGFATNYSYDSVGRLKQLTDKDAKSIVSYSYNTLGQLSREDNGNGTYTAYSYDDAGQALSLVNYKADNSINSRNDYTYNQLGQRTSMTTLEGKTSYGYDLTGQLTSVALASGRNIEYKYDAAGNRITVKDSGATTNYSTNNLNQYTTVGGNAYTYDKDGNLTSKTIGGKTSRFSYDIENRLIGVTNADGTWQYQYDALGNRIGSTFNGQKTDYLLDPTGLGDVVGEYIGSQATRYSHGLGLVSRNDGTNTSFFDTDAIGSVVGLSGTSGNYLNSYSYLPFGESLTKTETVANSFEYVGQYGVMNEANGLDFMRARFYTPGEGRFISADPIGISGGLNLYEYVLNNPTNLIDPIGLRYVDVNFTGGAGGGTTTGLLFSPKGVQPYSGFGVMTPGLGVSIQESSEDVTPGWNTGFSANNFGVGGQYGYDNTTGAQFSEIGLAGPLPGASLTRYYVYPALDKNNPLNKLNPFDPNSGLNPNNPFYFRKPNSPLSPNPFNPLGPLLPFLDPRSPFSPFNPNGLFNPFNSKSPFSPFNPNNPNNPFNSKPEAKGNTTKVRAFDPNDIIGPGGTGTDRWLTPDPILPYTIRFENVATATAPAVLVNIIHTLDSDLDLNTFELGDFGFGSTTITVPDGLQNYTTRLDLRDTIGDFVDFTATLDTATRLVTWKIITIDPLTGEPAQGVTDGFLPPNNANGDGDGFVNYRIKAKGDTPNGASLDAQASIVFDTNAPIVTPVWSNKIDTNAPTSKVQTLAATTAGKDLTVTWAGTDDGSGVGKYDVYVAVDGGSYTLWQNQTDKTSATYTGEIGKTYSFYSIATDAVGRTETKTATAETTTKLIELPTVPTISTITISVTDADLAETPTGQPANPGQFTLTRSGATTADLTVNYTLSGTATNGTDYQNLTGTATFAAGKDTAIIDLNVIDDNIYEGTETVTLSLVANPAYIIPAAPSPSINITDNETKPIISIANISQNEASSGTTNYGFNLTLSNPSTETITVKYATADDTATAGSDYTAATGTVTFVPGETTKIVNVVVTGDTLFEADETFKLNLSDPVNATILTTSATGSIVNDDVVIPPVEPVVIPPVVPPVEPVVIPPVIPPVEPVVIPPVIPPVEPVEEPKPVICISDAYPKFGKEGDPDAAYREFDIYLSHASVEAITVEYATVDGTAIGGSDFESTELTTLTFAPGETCKTISVAIYDDDIYESKESFQVQITNSTNATIGHDRGTAKIIDDDLPGISLFVTDDQAAETKAGKPTNPGEFTFKRTGLTTDVLNVKYSIEGSATNGTDYNKVENTLTFAAGSDTSTIEINPLIDKISEGTEAVTLKLSTSDDYTIIGKNSGTVNITDLVLKVETINNFKNPIGNNLQGKPEGEVLDLRSFAGQTLKVDTVSVGDAAYQNYIGFYAVEDAQGTLANGLKVGDAGYAQAAIKSAILRSSKIETQSDRTISGGKIFAPVVIANGTFEDFLNRNPQNQANSNIHAYFNYVGANTDKVDHFRLLGDNKFGVEDLYGGGDRDYNDIVFQMTVKG